MKIKFTLCALSFVAISMSLQSCSTEENELQLESSRTVEYNITTEMQSKENDTLPSDNEPIIVRPRR